MIRIATVFCTLVVILPASVRADVQEFTDKSEWESAVGAFSTIAFSEYPSATPITNQYRDELGVAFIGLNFIFNGPNTLPNDGFGLHGPNGIHMVFDQPIAWLAVDHPGTKFFELYFEGELIHTTSNFGPSSGIGNFGGIESNTPFDEVRILNPSPVSDTILIDDLHFGPPIPAPGVLGVFALAAVAGRGRRRG